MLSIFKFLYRVGKYIELEYDTSLGKEIQQMGVNSVPIKLYDKIYKHFKEKNNIPNTAADIFLYLKNKE
jgi:hypothetical protein